MADEKPWFLVMTPADANHPESEWLRVGASRGKVVALPIAPQGWIALLVFIVLLVAVPWAIWGLWFASGTLPAVGGVVLTFVLEAAVIVGFVILVRARMTRLPRRN